ncbi:MAG: hypothetical protein AAGA93_15460 [Actinomycetota bacterium]
MDTGTSAQFHALVEQDLNAERASALGRAGRRLATAVAGCAAARHDWAVADQAGDALARRAAADDYREAFARYERARADFCIQREANRLYDHRLVDRYYQPPTRPGDLRPTDRTGR